MLRIEKTEDKQFPYRIYGVGGGRPQSFTEKALKELHKLISAEITIRNSEYKSPLAQACEICYNAGSEVCNKCTRNPYATDMFETNA